MQNSCADTARAKINACATDFLIKAEGMDKTSLATAFVIMRSKIGTKKQYGFTELPEETHVIVARFWNQVVSAYAFCQESQRGIVANFISQTLNRLMASLGVQNV